MGLFEPGSDRGRCGAVVEYRGVVPVYPIGGGYVGILEMGRDGGEKGVSTRVKSEARLH